jgi:hypothetical protein
VPVGEPQCHRVEELPVISRLW